jgi:ferric-dicitrate binding protein FerR (iron transport regulator)
MDHGRIHYLFERFFRNACTDAEREELAYWIARTGEEDLKRSLTEAWNRFEPMDEMPEKKADEMFSIILKNRPAAIRGGGHPVRRIWLIRVAAMALLIMGLGAYFFLAKRPQGNEAVFGGASQVTADLLPGQAGAVLTLSDGSRIVLDTAANGELAEQGHTKVINRNGRLSYYSKEAGSESLYNTLTTHRGEQYPVVLSDGTKVWLNAASSIRFPVAFNSKERFVEITGEAYFEVVHDAKMPFKVKVRNEIIEDIGTRFNINAYTDEAAVRTTLVEGSVKVTLGSSNVLLRPGEQSVVSDGSMQIRVSPADGEAAIAWKNGFFELTNADVASIMRQLARWYDVEVVYSGDVPKGTISGEVPRNLNLSELLKVLALSGIRCELEGRKLVVSG